jgi:tetratricopeptide (TPR) repeat protein
MAAGPGGIMAFTTSRLRAQFQKIQQARQAGQTAIADMLASQLLAAMAVSADDFYCQASILMDQGRFADALKRFDAALTRGPAPPEVLVDRAVALSEMGRIDEALASCEAALKVSRDFLPAHLVMGDTLRAAGRPDEAVAHYDKAVGRKRDFLPGLQRRADLALETGRFEDALADFDRLLRAAPEDPDLLVSRGQVLAELLRHDEALAVFERVLARDLRNLRALHNRGVTLWQMARFDEALASYDKALALNANNPVTMTCRANTLQDLGRLDEAMAVHDRVLALSPRSASGHWNRAQGVLLQGKWKEGFSEFEWYRQRPESPRSPFDGLRWTGAEALSGRTLAIYAEQGLGDTLQGVRYAALAQERGAKVILMVQKPLVRLLREHLVPPVTEVIAQYAETPPHDFQVGMMSLPFVFGTETHTVPASAPYLTADPAQVARWGERIGSQGLRIGICWQGGQPGADMGRGFPLAMLEDIARLPGVRLIALQKGAGLAQLASLPPGMTVEMPGEDFDEGPDAFLDSAAVMENLDLVISSDTSIVHLAGALARPVWMAAKYVPEWRWLLGREDSVWYPTLRLFRQQAVGDWRGVFTAMETELKKKL